MIMGSEFQMNPFEAPINPSKERDRKLFLAATKERGDDQKITVKQDTAKKLAEMLGHDSNRFGWAALVHNIQVGPKKFLSILRDTRKLKLQDVLLQAKCVWGDPRTTYASTPPSESEDFVVEQIDPSNNELDKIIFYCRVRSKMIWERIRGSLSTASEQALMSQKQHFQWSMNGSFEYDGPTAAFLLMESVNPNTRVGVTSLKKKIRETRLGGFNGNVRSMLNSIQSDYTEILEFGGSHDNIVMDTFSALLSSKNSVFRNFIQRKKDKWELGVDVSLGELKEYALTKYNNMVEQKIWSSNNSAESKLLALLTNFEGKGASSSSGPSGGSSKSAKSGKMKLNIDKWRMKKDGATKSVEGKIYHWCPHHKLDGVFNGLYMTHDPGEGHQKWLENKRKMKEKRSKNKSGSSGGTSSTGQNSSSSSSGTSSRSSGKMALSDKLKTVLATKLQISENEAQSLVGDVVQDLN